MAWYMELTEWVNTLERFKNWKQNKGKPLDVQLDELADVLAFGLSLYLQVGGRSDTYFGTRLENLDKYVSFKASNFRSQEDYGLAFLGDCLHLLEFEEDLNLKVRKTVLIPLEIAQDVYSIDQLLDAYEMKMKVNHDRQDNGY